MDAELTHHLGRQKYERLAGRSNHRNGGYQRRFCIKGIGDVGVKVPRTATEPFRHRYFAEEQAIRRADSQRSICNVLDRDKHEDAFTFKQETDRPSISHEELSKASRELKESVERWRNRDPSKEQIK